MTDPDLARRRLRAQRLTGERFDSAPEAVRFLTAVQSQDYPAACWALAQRVTGSAAAGIDADYTAGRLLRTHVLRPTWHFVDPADLRWLLTLTSDRVHGRNAPYYRQQGLDAEVFGPAEDVIRRALAGGVRLTRPELGARLAAAGIDARGVRLTLLVMHAELEAVICSGGLRGRQHSYALLDQLVPAEPLPDRDELLGRLVRRYLTGHGPARVRDAAWWSGLTMGDIRRGIEIAGAALEREQRGDVDYWSAPAAGPPVGSTPPAGVHLLPNYDEFLVGYTGHEEIYDVERFGPAMGNYDLLGHVLLVDGEVRGGWRRAVRGGRVALDVRPLVPLQAAEIRLLAAEAARYGEFVGLPVDLRAGI